MPEKLSQTAKGGLQNLLLTGMHDHPLFFGQIVVTKQMQETMDRTEGDLVIGGVTEPRSGSPHAQR
jgi:hypothetical protein